MPSRRPLHGFANWRRFAPRKAGDGADARIRTADLRFTKPLLCQLSYAGNGPILLLVSLPFRESSGEECADCGFRPPQPGGQEMGKMAFPGPPAEGSRGGGHRVSTASRPSKATEKRLTGNS